MRSERSPEPISDLRVEAVFACCSRSCLSRMRAASTPSAFSRFLCCERESWHSTTMPVGRWVTRIAESVLLTCWPPAPEARKVSMRSSAGLSTTVFDRVGFGQDRDGAGRGMDAALRLGLRHALHAVAAGLELELENAPWPTMRAITSL